MILYLTARPHDYTVESFYGGWAQDAEPRMTPIYYDWLRFARSLPVATYIFADLERLSANELAFAQDLWEQLRSVPGIRLLNEPGRVLRRFELLERLADEGINEFRNYRVNGDHLPDCRFPVFLRRERDHVGALSSLIDNRDDLQAAITKARAAGENDLLIVEFCDVADADGVFRKWSAFRVGDRIIPRHLVFDRDWMQKEPKLVESAMLEEEQRYLDENPHRDELMNVFELARIDYGRIDYGFRGDRLQVWEINTNPNMARAPVKTGLTRLQRNGWFVQQYLDALTDVDSSAAARGWTPVRFDVSLLRRVGWTRRRAAVVWCARRLRRLRRHRQLRRPCMQLIRWANWFDKPSPVFDDPPAS